MSPTSYRAAPPRVSRKTIVAPPPHAVNIAQQAISRLSSGRGGRRLLPRHEMLPETVEREREHRARDAVRRLEASLERGLEVERALLHREERLQELLVERDLHVAAKRRRDRV